MHPDKLFISDLDGTLFDTRAANIKAYELAFQEVGLKFSRTSYETAFGLPFDAMMDIVAPTSSTDTRKRIKELKKKFYRENIDLVFPNDGLISLLRFIHSQGYKVGLATTAQSHNALLVLNHFRIIELFDACVFGEEVTNGKPHPECYQLLMRKLKADPKNCIIFEDSDVGIKAAIESGAQVVRVAI